MKFNKKILLVIVLMSIVTLSIMAILRLARGPEIPIDDLNDMQQGFYRPERQQQERIQTPPKKSITISANSSKDSPAPLNAAKISIELPTPPDFIKDGINRRDMSKDEMLEMAKYIRGLEKQWKNIVSNLITKEFNLDAADMEDYVELRKEYHRERIKDSREYHQQMLEERGLEHKFNPTAYEKDRGAALKEEYREKLHNKFGEENFQRYLEILRNYNEKIKRQLNSPMVRIHI